MLPWVAVRVHSATGDDLGVALVPWPVELGDEITVEEYAWPVVGDRRRLGTGRGGVAAIVQVRPDVLHPV